MATYLFNDDKNILLKIVILLTIIDYKENDTKALRGEEHMQWELFERFEAINYNCFLTDCSITPIDKTDGSDPTRREKYWRKVLKTVAPYGLNTLNC